MTTAQAFLGMTGEGDRWSLPVVKGLTSALGTLWGGCGLAAVVLAAEGAAGRPVRSATVQYVRPIVPGQQLDLTVTAAGGRSVSQAVVQGRVDGRLVLSGLASLGGRGALDLQLVTMPEDVPDPQDCAPRRMPLPLDATGTLLERFDQRWAQAPRSVRSDGRPGTGRTRVWIRLREPVDTTAATLAVLADLQPSAISEAVGEVAGGVSLDNGLRLARDPQVPAGGWVLLDLAVEAVVADVAQLSARLFDTDGRLLALAAQSAVVRRWEPPVG